MNGLFFIIAWGMKLQYQEFSQRARQIIEERGGDYFLPDFSRLLSLALRLVVEVEIALHLMRKSGYVNDQLYARLYESCGLVRRGIVRLKDMR